MTHFGCPIFAKVIVLGTMANFVDGLDSGLVNESLLNSAPKVYEDDKNAFEIGYGAFRVRSRGTEEARCFYIEGKGIARSQSSSACRDGNYTQRIK